MKLFKQVVLIFIILFSLNNIAFGVNTYDPTKPDSDNDLVNDEFDKCPGTHSNPQDVDKTNGCSEKQKKINTDGDAYPDYKDFDIDNDGLKNEIEIAGWDVQIGKLKFHVTSDPYIIDSDGDGLDDDKEYVNKYNPNKKDTDLDGVNDKDDKELTSIEHRKYIDENGVYQKSIEDNSDDDGDLIKNKDDKCINSGTYKVYQDGEFSGCSTSQIKLLKDDDGDNVINKKIGILGFVENYNKKTGKHLINETDNCPNTIPGTKVFIKSENDNKIGCAITKENDTNNNGIFDNYENFPDTDGDGVKDNIDTERNTINSKIAFVCLPEDIDNEQYSCTIDNIGKYSPEKFNSVNDSDGDGISDLRDNQNHTNKAHIKYICNENDVLNSKYGCNASKLGVYNEIKYFATTQYDEDHDMIPNYNSNGEKLDNDNSTKSQNYLYVCNSKDVINNKYGCDKNHIGVFNEIKKGIITKEAICTQNDIDKQLYDCTADKLDKASQIKYKAKKKIDTDLDGIPDYDLSGKELDHDNSTSNTNKPYICTKNDAVSNKYNCTLAQIGKYSKDKYDYKNDNDGDGINNYFDKDDNTPKANILYICNSSDISQGKYGCSPGDLGKFSSTKKSKIQNGETGVEAYTPGVVPTAVSVGQNKNYFLKWFGNKYPEFFQVGLNGGKGIMYLLVQIAYSLKNIIFFLATLFYLIIAIKLLVADKTEEQVEKFKKGIVWVTIGLIIMQMAYAYTLTLYAKEVGELLAFDLIDNIINPLIGLMEVLASFFFLAIALFAFYRLVTAHGNEEELTRAKMTIVYAVMGMILLKIAQIIVNGVYGTLDCQAETVAGYDVITTNCIGEANIDGLSETFINIINWVNGFVGIITIILIIYAGFKLLTSSGDEEKVKSAKSSLIYIFIGLLLLATNYLILTFFLVPESTI